MLPRLVPARCRFPSTAAEQRTRVPPKGVSLRASAGSLRTAAGVEAAFKASSIDNYDLLRVFVTVLRTCLTPVAIEIRAHMNDDLIHRHTMSDVVGDVWIGDEDVSGPPAPFSRETYLVGYGVNGFHQASKMIERTKPRGGLKPTLRS